jgi:hypothetical protein
MIVPASKRRPNPENETEEKYMHKIEEVIAGLHRSRPNALGGNYLQVCEDFEVV